ncbi:phospholipase A2 inhibitor gamma subunit B-like [Discoglossus pictus]
MSVFFTFTCVLSALIAAGYSLSCTHCTNNTFASCTGPSKTCPSGEHACVSTYKLTTVGGMEVSKMFLKQCEQSKICDKSISISFPEGRVKISNTCCFKDNCVAPVPTFPPDKVGKNGVTCVSCMAANAKNCTGDSVECIGNEDRCVTQTTAISEPISSTTVVRGCATSEVCVIGSQEAIIGSITITTDVTCTDGTMNLHHNLILLAMSYFIVFKLLF